MERNNLELKKHQRIINWWLTYHEVDGDKYWILHGNEILERKLIESSAIQCIFSFNKHQLVFESANTRYCCDLRYTLEEGFDWMYDSEIWLQGFSEKEILDYIASIQELQRKRGLKNSKDTALTLDTDEYLLLSLSDGQETLYTCGLYCGAGVYQYPKIKVEQNIDRTIVGIGIHSGTAEEAGAGVTYKIKESNVIELFAPQVVNGKVYVSNCGRNNLFVDTIFGRFCIPNSNRLYKISGDVLRGRVPVY